jgi:predicted nucleic acid-binding protein
VGAIPERLHLAIKDFFAVNFKSIPHTDVYILDILKSNGVCSLKRTAFTLGVKWFETRSVSSSRKSSISERPRGTRPAPPVEEKLLESLDPGEAKALAVAEVSDGMVITDDGDARTTAGQRGVNLTGSIGLLVRFVEDGHISTETADEYLKRWIDEAGFRSLTRDFDVFFRGLS